MADTLHNLQSVYEKWEKKGGNSHNTSQTGHTEKASKLISDGRQRWKTKYGDSVRPTPLRRTRRMKYPKLRPAESVENECITYFKTTPIVDAEAFRVTRPFMGLCCNCMPSSKKTFYSTSVSQQGLRNVLNVHSDVRRLGPLGRTFSHLAYTLQRRTFFSYTNVSMAVLSSGRVNNAIQQSSQLNPLDPSTGMELERKEDVKTIARHEKRLKSIINTMSARVRSVLVSFTGWFLLNFLSLMTRSIQVHKGQMHMIKKASERDLPMIYVPLHRSHLDYILVTFILWHYDIKAPHICAGDNLNLPVFGSLMRGLGAFFIRRRLDKEKGQKDILYRSVLQSYVEELLRHGEALEFFIEGGRSRTGKACSPKAGLLSVIVDAFRSDVIEDAYIVPVTISYEKLLDGNFNNEHMGRRKNIETFWGALKGIWRVMNNDFGHVRIDLCQPFSLKEFMITQASQVAKANCSQGNESCSEVDPNSPTNSEDSLPEELRSRHGSYSSLLGSDMIDNDQKEIVKSLGQHIVHTSVHSTALMSTNLVAFLLLTKYREGTSQRVLVESVAWLQDELARRNRDVGFTGDTVDVVLHAMELCGERLIQTSLDKNGNVVIRPVLEQPAVFELSYHSNAVISVFLLESVVANGVLGAMETGLSTVNGTVHGEITAVAREEVLDIAMELCKLFKNEFIFAPPCEELEQVLAETLDELVTSEVLRMEETKICGTVFEKQWARRFTESVEWHADDEDDSDDDDRSLLRSHLVKVNVENADRVERLQFVQMVLGPYIEAYWMTAMTITKLRDKEMAEEDFLKLLLSSCLTRVEKNIVSYPESVSMEILRNAVRTFQELKLIDSYYAGNLKMVELHDHFLVEEKLNNYIDLLERLRE